MTYIPQRLIPNESKLQNIIKVKCQQCYITKRSPDNPITPDKKIDVNIINKNNIPGWSVNFIPCINKKLDFNSNTTDVNYQPIEIDLSRIDFVSNSQLIEKLNTGFKIKGKYLNEYVLILSFNKVLNIDGTYQFGSEGLKKKFILDIIYKPVLSNVMHFEVVILEFDSASGNNKPLSKSFVRSNNYSEIISQIRKELLKIDDYKVINPA